MQPMRRKNYLLLALMGMFIFLDSLPAVPADPSPVSVLQPDGTVIWLQAYGDEFYHFSETIDGRVVIRNEDGWWVYATLDAEGQFVPTDLRVVPVEKQNSFYKSRLDAIPFHLRESAEVIRKKKEQFPTIPDSPIRMSFMKTHAGTHRILLLLVQFPDLPAREPAESFQQMVNDDSWHRGSMNAYFRENSYGTLSIHADYRPWINARENSSYYARSNPDGYRHVAELVRQAVDAAEAAGVDFSLYDNDNDGRVDGLVIVHSGPGAEEGGQTQYIWSHRSSISWAALSVRYDGVLIDDYMIVPELYRNRHVEIGVLCHEYGHILGLPDLYDTNEETGGNSQGLGTWALMAKGSWGGNGASPDLPAHFCAWSKIRLGWIQPVLITQPGTIQIPAVVTHATVYMVWLSPQRDNEYILIENRQKQGFDANLRGSGLLIYRVDRDMSEIYPASNTVNAYSDLLGVKLLQADGANHLDLNAGSGDSGDPFPGSSNNRNLTPWSNPSTNLRNGELSGVSILNISDSGPLMSAYVEPGTAKGFTQEYYEYVTGWGYGSQSKPWGYGLIRFIPSADGYLTHLKVFATTSHSSLQIQVYSTFNGSKPSKLFTQTQFTNPDKNMFHTIPLPVPVPVRADTPVYVQIRYEKKSGGYAVPIDHLGMLSQNCFYSGDGSSYNLLGYDIPVRAVFQFQNPEWIEDENQVPLNIILHPNYPNPFNSSTIIPITLFREAEVEVEIFDLTGRKIRSLVNGKMAAGTQRIVWEGDNDAGKPVASGMYFYRIRSGKVIRTGKMVLVK